MSRILSEEGVEFQKDSEIQKTQSEVKRLIQTLDMSQLQDLIGKYKYQPRFDALPSVFSHKCPRSFYLFYDIDEGRYTTIRREHPSTYPLGRGSKLFVRIEKSRVVSVYLKGSVPVEIMTPLMSKEIPGASQVIPYLKGVFVVEVKPRNFFYFSIEDGFLLRVQKETIKKLFRFRDLLCVVSSGVSGRNLDMHKFASRSDMKVASLPDCSCATALSETRLVVVKYTQSEGQGSECTIALLDEKLKELSTLKSLVTYVEALTSTRFVGVYLNQIKIFDVVGDSIVPFQLIGNGSKRYEKVVRISNFAFSTQKRLWKLEDGEFRSFQNTRSVVYSIGSVPLESRKRLLKFLEESSPATSAVLDIVVAFVVGN